MPTALIFLLSLCGILAAGGLFVAYAAWREARQREDEEAEQQAQKGGGGGPAEPA
jgi:hypothetical protein